jgi:cytoskeletal protein RodZ
MSSNSINNSGDLAKKSGSNKIVMIAVVIVAAVIIGCILRFYGNLQSEEPDAQNDVIVSETEKATQSGGTVPTEESTQIEEETEIVSEKEQTNVTDVPDVTMEHVTGAFASSVLVEDKYNLVHGADNVLDKDNSTAWSEGVSGNGIGEVLTITLDEKCVISGIIIMNGYQKSENLYQKNSRPSDLEVEFSDGTTETIHIHDQMGWETLNFSQTHVADEISFFIKDVYEGTTYEDTLITEIEIF